MKNKLRCERGKERERERGEGVLAMCRQRGSCKHLNLS